MALPETKLSIFKNGKSFKLLKALALIPGTVMVVPIRKTKMIKIVNRILDRTCLILNASFNSLKNIGHLALIRKAVIEQMANISYIVYILVSLLSQVYVYISSKGIVGKVFTSPENIATHSNSLLLGTVLGFIISLIYLSIVVFKLIQQQKEAEKAELAANE